MRGFYQLVVSTKSTVTGNQIVSLQGKYWRSAQAAAKEQSTIAVKDVEKFSTRNANKVLENSPFWKVMIALLGIVGIAVYGLPLNKRKV